jgi:hypothetical protein
MPLLPKLHKSYIKPLQPVLDQNWRYDDMSRLTNYWNMRNNDDWRLKEWYLFEASTVVPDAYQPYSMFDQMILQNPGIADLTVLDRDAELYAWYGSYQDVYPSVNRQCEGSPLNIQINFVLPPRGIIVSIEGPKGGGKGGVPENLARLFLGMYQPPLEAAKQQQPPDQQTVNQLQPLVDQLTKFIATLF